MYVPYYTADIYCSKHRPYCRGCKKQFIQYFPGQTECIKCEDAMKRGECTSCGKDIQDEFMSDEGHCLGCVSSERKPNIKFDM